MSGKTVKKRVHRYDRFAIGTNVQATPQGFLKIPANITRTGVLEYQRADGSTWRELRLPEEVQRADSLETLEGAPVTEDHHGLITPDNVTDHQVGYVAGNVNHDGRLVSADLVIQKRATINGVRRGDFKEVSAGYIMDAEQTPGEWNGERYDAIQRNIVYNHVAIGPEDWARGGGELKLRTDGTSKDSCEWAVSVRLDDNQTGIDPVESKPTKRGEEMKKIIIRLDGVDYPIEVPEALAPNFEKAVEGLQSEAKDKAERLDSVQGELDAAKKAQGELKAELDKAKDPAAIDKAVKARAKLVEDCKKLDPDLEVDGKNSRELKVAALEKAGFEAARFDGKSDGYVDGVFVGSLKSAPKGERSVGILPVEDDQTREDAKKESDKYDSDKARQEMIERNQNAWMRKE